MPTVAVGVQFLLQYNLFRVQKKKRREKKIRYIERRSETRYVPGRPPNNRFQIIFPTRITFMRDAEQNRPQTAATSVTKNGTAIHLWTSGVRRQIPERIQFTNPYYRETIR